MFKIPGSMCNSLSVFFYPQIIINNKKQSNSCIQLMLYAHAPITIRRDGNFFQTTPGIK
ncbi:hypothetical protein DAI22_05g287700 [Oryza sativa Japonica Group]|nr:hypothetical protein DAI22_05g287700 [Oryza sativa Japonica Group]